MEANGTNYFLQGGDKRLPRLRKRAALPSAALVPSCQAQGMPQVVYYDAIRWLKSLAVQQGTCTQYLWVGRDIYLVRTASGIAAGVPWALCFENSQRPICPSSTVSMHCPVMSFLPPIPAMEVRMDPVSFTLAPVMVNFMCHLGWAVAPSYVVKHYSGFPVRKIIIF